MDSSISRSPDTRAIPPVGPVRNGKAHPLPTKSSLIPGPRSIDLDEGALHVDHGASLQLRRGTGVHADGCGLHGELGRALGAHLDTLHVDVAGPAVDLDAGVRLHADLPRLESEVARRGDLDGSPTALRLDLDTAIGI